jgi:hypothetical protein
MAQYEPKTDSKEFELITAGPGPIPAPDAVPDPADITIRLWQPERPAAGSLTWRTESVLVYMIADLVAASRGRVDDSSPAMQAHFDGCGPALVAAKRIQTSILEFLACRPGDSLASAVLIHPPSSIQGGFTTSISEGALRLAEPGQILLSEATAARLRSLPGIELRSVPALTTGGDEQTGLSELIWASPDKLGQLQRPVTGRPPGGESLAVGATMIVNAPLGSSAGLTGKTAQSSASPTGLVAQDKMAATRSQKLKPDATGDLGAARETSLPPAFDEEERPSFFTRTRLILGAVAIVLVSVLVWEFHPWNVSRPPVPAHENPGPQATQQSLPPQPPAQEPKITEPEATQPRAVLNSPARTKPAANRHVNDKAPAAAPAPTPPEQPPAEVVVDGMTQKDIPQLLQMAKADAGNGNYEKARREYRIVQRLQPSNPDAKDGLRRLDIAQSDNQ